MSVELIIEVESTREALNKAYGTLWAATWDDSTLTAYATALEAHRDAVRNLLMEVEA